MLKGLYHGFNVITIELTISQTPTACSMTSCSDGVAGGGCSESPDNMWPIWCSVVLDVSICKQN